MADNGQRAYRDNSENLHTIGEVKLANKWQLEGPVAAAVPLLEACGNMSKAILAPLSRYLTGPCCDIFCHCTNIDTDHYKQDLTSGISSASRYIKELLNSQGIRRHRVLNVTSTVLELQAEQAWADPTMLGSAAYSAILRLINAEAGSILAKRIIPPQTTPEPKRHRILHETPGPSRERRQAAVHPSPHRHTSARTGSGHFSMHDTPGLSTDRHQASGYQSPHRHSSARSESGNSSRHDSPARHRHRSDPERSSHYKYQ